MRMLIVAFFSLFATLPAWGQVRGIEITEHGIYTADLESSTRDSQGVKQNISTNFRLGGQQDHFRSAIAGTDKIPVRDDPWELVPGLWTIELWYNDRKLAEQRFTLVAPLTRLEAGNSKSPPGTEPTRELRRYFQRPCFRRTLPFHCSGNG